MRKLIALAGLLPTMLAPLGCDSKAANRSNFQTALQAAYDKHPRCAPWFEEMPVELNPKGAGYRQDAAKYEALRAAGLVTSQSSMKVLTDPFQTFVGIRNAPTPIITYSIGGANRSAWSGQHDICYAKVRVTSVDNFTEPSESLGFKGSQVSFTYDLTDVPAWAKEAALQNAVPEIKTDLQRPEHTETETLVLTANGWKTAQDLR